MSERRRVLVGVGLLAALGGLTVWLMRAPATPPEPSSRARSDEASSGASTERQRRVPERRPLPGGYQTGEEAARALREGKLDPAERDLALAAIRQDRRYQQLRDAIEATRFPPDSRPLTRDMTDTLKPNRRYEEPKVIRDPNREGETKDPEDEPRFLFTADKFMLQRGERIRATLEVWDGAPDREPPPTRQRVELTTSALYRYGQPYELVGTVPLNDDGGNGDAAAGDGLYSVSFDPFALVGEQYNGTVRFDISFTLPSVGVPTVGRLQFQLVGQAPAQFTKRVFEKLTDEGLELGVEVEVKEAGRYLVQGLLFSEGDDEPIGFAVWRGQWDAGVHVAPLSYFGLLFHEAGKPGPYVLKTLTGYRMPVGDEPRRRDMPMWDGGYRTKAYELAQFSSDEWDSEQRDRQLDGLEDLARENPEKTAPDGGRLPPAEADGGQP